MEESTKQLIESVETIAREINEGVKVTQQYIDDYGNDFDLEIGEDLPAHVYLNGMLDINYIVDAKLEYRGAEVLVAFGGPNIYINTKNKTVEGYWGGDSCIRHYYNDPMGVDEYCQDMYENQKQ